MEANYWEQLENEIYNKIVAYEYSDAGDKTLSGFIVTLLQVGKNAQDVDSELLQLVGTDYDSNLTEWIFARKQALEAPVSDAVNPVKEAESSDQQQQQPQHREQQHATSFQNLERNGTDKPKGRIFSQALGVALNNDRRRSDFSTRFTSTRRSERSRSRSRSPERRFSRNGRQDRTSRHDQSHEKDSRRSGNVFSRIGNAKSEERPSVFDRLGGSKPNNDPERQNDSKKERCKYWPNCKNGDECIYFHPTTICSEFPNCPKLASECLGIHPQVAGPVMQPLTARIPIPCKFFPYCSNPVCPYIHPTMPPQQGFFMQGQPSFTKIEQRVQIPCKNGDACTRADCHFLHPKDSNLKIEVICKFDGACTRPNCFYKHTKENKPQNKALINKNESTNARQFSVPEDQVEERIVVGESADTIRREEPQQSADVDMES
ncbi:hypothetical protein [Parasitella parasitica]|uniref:Zinc finger CCCH domain-containing protein 14 n=1 Tax=Parasitella parasitica TaxID=35722 RepID=A0A0B7NCP3_9FUNG|nr:hypothetical protein [Parasitella parasitica]